MIRIIVDALTSDCKMQEIAAWVETWFPDELVNVERAVIKGVNGSLLYVVDEMWPEVLPEDGPLIATLDSMLEEKQVHFKEE